MGIRVSIIICTCNRAESLRETLGSIGNCIVSADLSAELLVVDNASTDDTVKVVREAVLTNMPVRYICEPRRGKCYAYNSGMAGATGEVFLFTDDDVRVPANWIEGMSRAIVCGQIDAVAGGIRLAPNLERPWLKGFLKLIVACTEMMSSGQEPPQLIGANMAFGRHVLAQVPSFDCELGPGALGFCDETLFSFQLVEAGYRLKGSWQVEVEHHFDEGRLCREGLRGIAERMGRSRAYLAHHWQHKRILLPSLMQAWLVAKLAVRNAVSGQPLDGDAPRPWEVAYLTRIEFLKQYRKERTRLRNYKKFGLIKINGVGKATEAKVSERSSTIHAGMSMVGQPLPTRTWGAQDDPS